jgi:hypothetical protein
MKKIMISVAILIAQNGFSQMTETKKLAYGKVGWEINMQIKNGVDTTVYFYYSYQNKKYKQITDFGSLYMEQKEDLIKLANALKIFSKKESGVELNFKSFGYELRLYDFSEDVYIVDYNDKYTYITKSEANKMADELLANAKFLIK